MGQECATWCRGKEFRHAATEGQLAYVRADWFIATASRPPLYHELLQLPETERELEQQLHMNLQADIVQERVIRAGFNAVPI